MSRTHIAVALMLSALLIPATAGFAQGFRISSSKNGASSNSRQFNRSTNSRRVSSTPTFSAKTFKPSSSQPTARVPSTRVPSTRIPMNTFKPTVIKPSVNRPSNFGKFPTTKPRVPSQNLRPNVQLNPQLVKPVRPNTFKPVKPAINVGNLGTFTPRPTIVNKTPKFPVTKVNGVNKLVGLDKFKDLTGKVGNQKFQPIKLQKLNGNLANVWKGGNLKIAPAKQLAAKQCAIQNLSLAPHCHWWVDFVAGCHWNWNNCHWWDYCHSPGYWNCWTPCHYQIVYCPSNSGYVSSSWYFGVDCILVPDMAAYGIQDVKLNSPAALAGLQQGDLIVSINGLEIADESVLPNAIQTSGGLLNLGVIRNGAEEPVLVQVALRRIQKLSY